MRWILIGTLAWAAVGCSRQPAHVLSGGKPLDVQFGALKNSDAKLRREAVEKIGNIGPADERVVPALQEALADRDARVRCEAILGLIKCGAAAEPAFAALADLQTKDADRKVREYAKNALTALRQKAATGDSK